MIDGIEISNSRNFYPEIVRRAIEKKLYMVSATDCHKSTASIFGHQDFFRDMTLIFAKDKSEKELRKALLSQKTLGYCGGYIIGEESLLEKFFKASVTATYSGKSKKGNNIILTNSTSIAYTLNNNGTIIKLPAHSSVSATIASKKAVFTVENMYHVDEKHPVFEL